MRTDSIKLLEKVLSHFTLEEFYHHVIHEFPEVTLEQIERSLRKIGGTTTKATLIKILLKVVTVINISKKEIDHRISNLELMVIGKSSKRIWIAYDLLEKYRAVPETTDDLKMLLNRSIAQSDLLAIVNAISFNNRFIISIMKKIVPKRGTRVRYCVPVYFVFDRMSAHFFCSRIIRDNEIMTAFSKALGYERCKYAKLSGKSVSDMLMILENKNKPNKLLIQPKVKVKRSEFGTDYTRAAEREQYADELYGNPPPSLQCMSFVAKDQEWCTNDMSGETSDIHLEYRSKNVLKLIQELILHDVVVTPVPDYLEQILCQGKNIYTLNTANN